MASAPTIFLQEPSFKWKLSPQLPTLNPFAHNHIKIRKNLKKLSINCLFTGDYSSTDRRVSKNGFGELEIKQNPAEIVAETIKSMLKALRKPAAAAVLVGLLLMYDPNSALAASGGRMGGRSFSSSRSSSAPSQSYSTPRMGAGSGFSFSAPYYAPSPFGGVYVGPAVGVGSGFSLIMIAFVAFVLVSGFLSDGSQGSVLTATDKTTVLKLQVGLLGLGRSLQKDLNRIAEIADTSTSEGLHYVLTETVLALLRHPDYCISGYSSVSRTIPCSVNQLHILF
ncbi:hypothetical protein SASPL_102425 [Salvia splendens]|uniref:Uncharacterized protein n=1 Tax=Salvia splendens TaxID=180675 RepID=A0A8X9AC47_SALSN|nr:hypothetical protein SASPL_102425 [Salvia splendens]